MAMKPGDKHNKLKWGSDIWNTSTKKSIHMADEKLKIFKFIFSSCKMVVL